MSRLVPALGLLSFVSAASLSGGCSSSSSNTNPGAGGTGATCASPGGPAASPVDDHCAGDSGPIVVATGACVTGVVDGGPGGGGEPLPGPWGGTSAADDDCKYDASYTMTAVCRNEDIVVILTLKKRTDHAAVTGASPGIEVLDPSGIPAATGSAVSTETSSGVYKITPIRFDRPGKWTIRFHLFETCSDTPEDSPHGHVAFFVNVP